MGASANTLHTSALSLVIRDRKNFQNMEWTKLPSPSIPILSRPLPFPYKRAQLGG